MENERGKQEVLMALQGVGRLGIMMDPVFKLTAAGTILLIQHFARMYKEGLLNRREFQNFQEFAKLTEGNYQIINIPVGSWKELEKTGFVHQMEERGVRYVELPDLNQTDGLVQVAIYGEDQLKFQAWYDRFLMAEMKGGEHELQNLNHLTSGRTSIVSIPVEQKIDLLTDDFAVLQVNYSILPDLQVGDGEIQVVVANADLAKVEHWYRMYQEQCLSEGKEIPDFQTMDMGKYRETGVMKTISPFNAFLLLQGTETLSLRIERHNENTKKVVEYLSNHPLVEKVNHPSLPDHPDHGLYEKYFPNGGASIFTFDIKGGQEEAHKFIDNLQLFSLLANVADVKSLVIHPATTTHSQCTAEELAEQNINPNTIRLSIGTENIDDIIEDLDEAFRALQ